MTGSIHPPEGVVGSDDWTAIDSKTGKKLTDEEASKLTDAEVDWLKNDGVQWTYDSKNKEYIEFKNKNPDGSGGVDKSYKTKVYDPDHPDSVDGWRDDETTTSVDNDNDSHDPTNTNTATPFGIFNPDGTTQGWDAYVDGQKITPEAASKLAPETVTWKNASDPNNTISWDPEKKVWVQNKGSDTLYYDPRHKTNSDNYSGEKSGWNDKNYYEKYQAGTATPIGVYTLDGSNTQGWTPLGDHGTPLDLNVAKTRDPEKVKWTATGANGVMTIEWNLEKKVWEKTGDGPETLYYDPRVDPGHPDHESYSGDESGWNNKEYYEKYQNN
ncbi:hypothetical protein D3871_10250 [Noviherbaspirillum saxi]|uniref:Uncharacterized protein n=2 Tax=Noviherbaspirillum saxi TaxID=2320863 RepID=A0A3A3FU94_9BURK|nr:hypothetical protein D3871_10250 [Noviherbaspirillum saxi]